MINWEYNDGGRLDAGFNCGKLVGDCVVRAIAIAVEIPYREVWDDLKACQQAFSKGRSRAAKACKKTNCNPDRGTFRTVYEPYLKEKGFAWFPVMGIGTGCKMHLRKDELPEGRIIARVSKHLVAAVDGVLQDTHDCSRNGTRCVYGYFLKHGE
tara:strand:- start:887 stop:1348 length:462 start_codon:yes stop_codon:yes gene_type:complete